MAKSHLTASLDLFSLMYSLQNELLLDITDCLKNSSHIVCGQDFGHVYKSGQSSPIKPVLWDELGPRISSWYQCQIPSLWPHRHLFPRSQCTPYKVVASLTPKGVFWS
jgi:hypothetical protein